MNRREQSPEFQMAAVKLTVQDVFFTALLYSLTVKPDSTFNGVAGTDGVNLKYNPEKFAEWSQQDRIFILAHEIMHVILHHSTRRGIRNPIVWNVAADFVVNLLLHDHGYKVPERGLFDKKYTNMTTEQVYDSLVKEFNLDDLEDKLGQDMKDIIDYDPENNEGKSVAEVERKVIIAASKAAEIAKNSGRQSCLIDRFVESIAVVKKLWHSVLAQYMTAFNNKEFDWHRLDFKRSAIYKMIMPKMQSESMGTLVLGIDCSGSMSEVQLASISTHVSDILNECRPSSVHIAYFDSKIVRTESHTGPTYDINLKMVGGGGTDFCPVIEYAEQIPDCSALLVFTDMEGPMPDSSNVNTLWVTSSKGEIPKFGTIIEADFND